MTVQELIDELNKQPKDANVGMYKVFQGEELYHLEISVSMKTLGKDRHFNLRDVNYHSNLKEKENFVCLDYDF